MKITIDRSVVEQALEALEHVARQPVGTRVTDAITALRAALAEPPMGKASTDVGVPVYVVKKAEPQEPASKMTAGRAAYFMARFKREEKMLGPNEQAALDFVISMLEAAPAQPSLPPDAETAWKMGYEAGKCEANGVLDLTLPPSPVKPVGIVSHLVKGDVVWQRWPADMPDGTRLWGEVQP